MPAFPGGFSDLASVTASTKFLSDSGSANGLSSASQIRDYLQTSGGISAVIAASAAGWTRNSVNAAGDTTETALTTVTVPANVMGANGVLRITSQWTITNSASSKVVRARFNGLAGTPYTAFALTTVATAQYIALIRNRGVTNSQVGAAESGTGVGSTTAAAVTSSIDTTAAVDIAFTAVWGGAASGESIKLESYLVELLRP